jgi:hypothetical protein
MEQKKNIVKKISYLNIDSRHREKNPKNKVKSNLKLLEDNPITVSIDSNLVKIKYSNHNLLVGQKILIQNIKGNKKKLSSAIYLINKFDYFLVKFKDHGINSSYLDYHSSFKVNIEMNSILTSSDYLIENIPINSLLGVSDAFLCDDIATLPLDLHKSLNITETYLNENYFLIKLPFNFISKKKKYNWSNPYVVTYDENWPYYQPEKLTYKIDDSSVSGTIYDVMDDLNDGTIAWEHPFAFVITDSSGSVLDSSGSVLDSSGSLLDSSGSVLDSSGSVLDSSGSVLDSSGTKAYWLVGDEIPYIFNLNKITEISFLNIGNIPLKYLNANFPINYKQYNGFHVISKIDDNNIYFNSKIKAFKDETSGGSKVNVSEVLDSFTGYTSSNNYKIFLKDNFVNVSSIELISVSIPYIDNIIISEGANKNNLLYWKQYMDGNKIYSIEIPEGDYNQETLKTKILSLMNGIKRIGSTLKNPIYNLFDLELDIKGMNFKIKSYREDNLPESITADTVKIDKETFYRLTIVHKNNLVEVDDTIEISGSNQVGVISKEKINSLHKVYSVDKTTNSYVVLFNYLNPEENTVDGNGGNEIKLKTKSLVSFLFDRPGTIGKLFGFKNTGQENAVTQYSHITTNFCNYIYSNKLNEVGIFDNNKNILKLSYYEKDYFLLILNDFDTISNNGSIPSCFAKIFINEVICEKFESNVYSFPTPTLSELDIKFINPDGTPTDFRNIENSFILKITENISVNNCTGINSKNLNYIPKTSDREVLLDI